MSLPPGFLDELRTRLSLSDVVGRKVMWDRKKSNQGKGDMWAPCPFHHEKTASFHVDDKQGYYYCFGCHAKGDAISFVRETENVGFMEAVEILAGEAGMQMPARDPRAQEKADATTRLTGVMEQAVQWFRLQLKTGAGAAARDYLAGRGLDEAAQERWGLGFAPPGWEGLREALGGKGVSVDDMLACRLLRESDKGRAPYDAFRNRIMFPIRDIRGRCIAFGGRAMDPADNAKYLNSSEGPLFDKGRVLFNHQQARGAVGKGQTLIVGEGYMDVIALSEAGFGAAVAPLGTAITEDQLQLLWRMSPEPVVALDGDKAGLRAAMRLIDMALPQIGPGRSLRFALLPEGKDPDDLIRAEGPPAMQAVLDRAEPLVELLWRRETEDRPLDSPERRAALDASLRAATGLIQDPDVRRHYEEAFKQRKWELFNPRRAEASAPAPKGAQRPWRPRGAKPEALPTPSTRSSALAAAGSEIEEHLREAVILATLLTHPELADEFAHAIEELDWKGEGHAAVAMAFLNHADAADPRRALEEEFGAAALEKLFTPAHVRIAPCIRNPGDMELARMCLAQDFAILSADRGAAREIAEAMHQIDGLADEGLTWRLGQASEARHRAANNHETDKADYDIAPNGARLDRSERASLDALLEQIGHQKPRGRRD
ncbi:DNA primase [Vannielia litorea]|uniref:DNA primase n=1 Tax=Vannielia litorea TaxID=1217970 RepID=UPI001C94D56B|nr:DNA primase [Vannielia litorea]MBY6046568.1 DNA primase [Vannielia litorea]MBY6073982.1 DNA primase [Vannielia litorea]